MVPSLGIVHVPGQSADCNIINMFMILLLHMRMFNHGKRIRRGTSHVQYYYGSAVMLTSASELLQVCCHENISHQS